ncbi:MAG: universal stress protein, partial [Vicinamibacterales bacterium]
SPSMEADILGSRTRRLEAAVEKHRGKCPSIQGRILRGKPSVALIQEVLRGRHDLLVRYHGRDLKAERGYGAVDMQLLRKCPCPVWLVGVGEKTRPKRVMAAVHPDPQHPEARALNQRIIHAAAELARLEKGRLVIMTAWAPFGMSLIDDLVTEEDLKTYRKAAETTAADALNDLLASTGDLGVKFETALVKGDPAKVIPSYAKRQDIDVIVMGTVARSGLVGMIMGNTAERVLQALRCSVLALKPDGFETPVRPAR